MIKEISPGTTVFAVLRDGSEEPVTVVGYIALARVLEVVIAAPIVNGHRDPEYILAYLMALTKDDDELPLVAVPVEDCYPTLEAAKEAMQNELDD